MIYNDQEYTLSAFDANFAESGGILFAQYSDGGSLAYEMATDFMPNPKSQEFPYKAKVAGKAYNFSPEGQTSQGLYTLMCASAVIDSAGAIEGDIQTKTDQGQTVYMSMSTLNYRESVALQVLNAMIGHISDPLSYSAATIKALISKAFNFSVEFVNQARAFRTANAHEEQGEIVPDAADSVTALNAITQKLEDIKTQTVSIKQALDGTTTNGVAAKVAAVATNVSTVGTNVATVGTNVGNVATNVATVSTKIEDGDDDIVNAIKRKVIIPEASAVIEGTVSTNTFTANSGQTSFADALSIVASGGVVVLAYPSGSNTIYDTVKYAYSSLMRTEDGKYWYSA